MLFDLLVVLCFWVRCLLFWFVFHCFFYYALVFGCWLIVLFDLFYILVLLRGLVCVWYFVLMFELRVNLTAGIGIIYGVLQFVG